MHENGVQDNTPQAVFQIDYLGILLIGCPG